jgi:hypothetical protein
VDSVVPGDRNATGRFVKDEEVEVDDGDAFGVGEGGELVLGEGLVKDMVESDEANDIVMKGNGLVGGLRGEFVEDELQGSGVGGAWGGVA